MSRINENVLEGLACPNCGHNESLRIEATTSRMVLYGDEGTIDDPGGDDEWPDDGMAECPLCGHAQDLESFRTMNRATMIRFVDLRGSSTGHWVGHGNFAFFDTVRDRFIEANTVQAWTDFDEFERHYAPIAQRTHHPDDFVERLRALTPEWAR